MPLTADGERNGRGLYLRRLHVRLFSSGLLLAACASVHWDARPQTFGGGDGEGDGQSGSLFEFFVGCVVGVGVSGMGSDSIVGMRSDATACPSPPAWLCRFPEESNVVSEANVDLRGCESTASVKHIHTRTSASISVNIAGPPLTPCQCSRHC